MLSSWLMNLTHLGKGQEKNITYTPRFYLNDPSILPDAGSSCSPVAPSKNLEDQYSRPKRLSRSRSPSSSSFTTSSSRENSGTSSRMTTGHISCTTRPGYAIVYAGSQKKRFIIPVNVVSQHLFKMVLEKLQTGNHQDSDSHDDDDPDAIYLSCEAEFLHRLLFLIDNGPGIAATEELRWDAVRKFLEGGHDSAV